MFRALLLFKPQSFTCILLFDMENGFQTKSFIFIYFIQCSFLLDTKFCSFNWHYKEQALFFSTSNNCWILLWTLLSLQKCKEIKLSLDMTCITNRLHVFSDCLWSMAHLAMMSCGLISGKAFSWGSQD
jgi:hypothetical protein